VQGNQSDNQGAKRSERGHGGNCTNDRNIPDLAPGLLGEASHLISDNSATVLSPLLSNALLPHRRSEAMANSEVKVAGHYTTPDPVAELQGGNGRNASSKFRLRWGNGLDLDQSEVFWG
jgi:hypothetical protein